MQFYSGFGLSLVVAAAVAFGSLSAPRSAQACSCLPTDTTQSYNQASDVVAARIVWGIPIGQTQWYIARVRRTLKGCIKDKAWVYLKTSASSAACGVSLQNGKLYIINGQVQDVPWQTPTLSIASCSANKPVSALTAAERTFLLSRTNCCDGSCACTGGQPIVNCFANPCAVTSCPTGTCEANYCGGCFAEFYDNLGYAVCVPCDSDADCAFSQSCQDGMCLGACSSNQDCGDGYWCGSTQGGGKTCKAYQQEGDYCGGFTPSWAQTQCAPGLICTDTPPFIADAPGTCRKPCKADDECSKDQYCGSGGVCRDDGACFNSNKDCNQDGNSYPHAKCIGHGICNNDNTCGWECGSTESLSWYATCGDPVCFPDSKPPEGIAACGPFVDAGADCDKEGAQCDAGLGCGAVLICATKDPKQQPGGCPISKRDAKEKIQYLDPHSLEAMRDQVLATRLASWRYKEGPKDAFRLGFIIEDQPKGSPAVVSGGDKVDVYAYASMAVAALQVQAKQIEALQQQVDVLTAKLSAPPLCQ